jgi:hypothetical protein
MVKGVRLGKCDKGHAVSTIVNMLKGAYDLTDEAIEDMIADLVNDAEGACEFANCKALGF